MSVVPEVRFVETDGGFIGYQVFGSGPPDLWVGRAGIGHVELMWEHPQVAALLRRLAGFARVIVHDTLGFGVSDPAEPSKIGRWEYTIDDVRAIRAAVGWDKGALVGFGGAATGSLLHAATDPSSFSSLVLVDGIARLVSSDDYPWGMNEAARQHLLQVIAERRFPSPSVDALGPPGWARRYIRAAGSPGVWRAVFEAMPNFDVRHILDSVHIPTLCLATASRSGRDPIGSSKDLATRIPRAELRVIDAGALSSDWMIFDQPDAVANEIQRFVTGAAPPVESDRVLAGVLFTDIVGSTGITAERGDASWRGHLDALDSLVATETHRLGGQVIKSTGDGHLLTFGGPSRAIQCGQAVRDAAASRLGLSLRAGVHVGEIELRGEDVAGIGVVIARRVCDLAGPGQILVSHAVPPLVAGADFSFVSRGTRQLKGVPGEWIVHEVA